MLLHGDLGLSGAAALVLLVFVPVVVFVVRRRWRLATARQAEVRRLARLAAQEAAEAEMEAMAAYAATSVAAAASASAAVAKEDPSARPECPVCFSPATARCARCKAVRYCSGKCQIIHWRQGHKDECHPPPLNDNSSGELNVSGLKGGQAEKSGSSEKSLEHKEEPNTKEETFSERSGASESTFSPNDFNGEDKHAESSSMDVSEKESTSGSLPASSIPNHSTSSRSIETPNNACASGNLFSLHNHRLGGSSSFDFLTSSLRTAVDSSNANPTKSSTPELARSSSLAKNTTYSSVVKEKAITSKRGTDESMSNGPSGLKATSFLDHTSTECSEVTGEGHITSKRVGNGFHPGNSSRSESFSHASASSEAKQSEDKETLTSNMVSSGSVANGMSNEVKSLKSKTSRSLASTSDHLSSNGGIHSVGSSYTSASIANELATSVKRVAKEFTSVKISRHYCSELMLFPYDRFLKLYNSDKIELRPCGLINCGNSCYANAVLQCLAFTRPLTAYLLEGLHSKICPKKEWCFTCELERLVMNTKEGKSPLTPIGILSHLHNIGSNFGHGQEEDAHEFLRYAIDAMQSACLKDAGAKPDGLLAEETTLIHQIFGGYLRSKIRCSRCKGKSERCERMMDLTVEIDGDIATLDEALLRFTSPEILDGENKYECDRCKSYERARKKLSILEAPNVLTIGLKRFQSGKFGKLNKVVRFREYLNLAPYMSGDDKSPVYRLYAVIVHIDVMNASFSGHYVCYVKDTQGKWYKINDSKVKPVELEKVLSKGAYMLLYARCSPRAPSSVRKAMTHELAQQARKIRSRDGRGNIGGSNYYPYRMNGDQSNFHPSDLFNERHRHTLNDSASDSSSLFDEGSSCSTESTRDSTSTEEYWERLSGESDSINLNSPLRVHEDSDGFTHFPLGSKHSSKAVLNGPMPDLPGHDAGSNSSSSGRGIDQAEVEGKPSFLYSDKSEHFRNLTEHCSRTVEADWFNPNEVKSGVLSRRPTRERNAQTFY